MSFNEHAKSVKTNFLLKIISCFRRVGINARLQILFITIILIPNVFIASYVYHILAQEHQKYIMEHLEEYTTSMSDFIDEKLRRTEDIVFNMCQDKDLLNLLKKAIDLKSNSGHNPEQYFQYLKSREEINNYLYNRIKMPTSIVNCQIIIKDDQFSQIALDKDVKGWHIVDLNKFVESDNFKKADAMPAHFIWCDTSKEYDVFEDQMMAGSFKNSYLTMFKAIEDNRDKRKLGMFVVNVSLSALKVGFGSGALKENSNILILSNNGIITFLNDNPLGPVIKEDTIRQIQERKTGIINSISPNNQSTIVFQESGYTGWITVMAAKKEFLLRSIINITKMILIVVTICILLGVLVSYFVLASIIFPLSALKRTMQAIHEENLEAYYSDTSNDEIAILGKQFNSMIMRIGNLIRINYEAEQSKRQEIIIRKEAELDALQMQINPHMIYNILDAIRWESMFLENGEGKVSKMISAFSDFLRSGTKKFNKLVTIQEEIEHVNAYLQVVRFTSKSDIHYKCEVDEIYDCLITKLVLQPLVENIFAHAIKETKKEIEITLIGKKYDDTIIIEIHDNGSGIGEEELRKTTEILTNDNESRSLGLRNVNRRIKLSFGESYGLSITSQPGVGTSVYVKIPCIYEHEVNQGMKS